MKGKFSKAILNLDTNAVNYKIVRNTYYSDLVCVEYIQESERWERFKIIRVSNHQILKIINCKKENYARGFIDTAFFLHMKGINYPVIAIESSTNHGNDGISIYKIENDSLQFLMSSITRTGGGETFERVIAVGYKNGKLTLRKTDINQDGYDDIEVGGTVIANVYSPKISQ